jgi:hypothetical protein
MFGQLCYQAYLRDGQIPGIAADSTWKAADYFALEKFYTAASATR